MWKYRTKYDYASLGNKISVKDPNYLLGAVNKQLN